jgi:flagellum-specific ATP synthase
MNAQAIAAQDDDRSPAPPQALERLERALAALRANQPLVRTGGIVTEVAPAHFRVAGLSKFLKLGECVEVDGGGAMQLGETVRIDEAGATIKSFEARMQAGLGAVAWRSGLVSIRPHTSWKGRVINALGRAIDGADALLAGPNTFYAERDAPSPMRRQRIQTPMKTGVRAIDLMTPLCAGQRIGIFAGSGIGKSTLLGMLARSPGFDTTVIGLIGERGREVREFLDNTLLPAKARTVAVVATGDESAMLRRLAPKIAMCIAEYFRDLGENVLLIIDSVTRYAHAVREVALAAGEPPVARGYTPSVFSDLPKLLERAGPGEAGVGSITGVFAVLVDGDDHNDPVADTIRGTLDGHIVLERAIADQGRYPAINVLTSVSRLANMAWTPEQARVVLKLRAMIAHFEDTRDLRLMGGYKAGTDAGLDRAIQMVPKLYGAIQQGPQDPASTDAFREIAQALATDTEPAPASPQ